MSSSREDGARLSIADLTRGKFEDELIAAGIRIVYTPLSGGAVRRLFQCPNPECEQRCAVLYHVRGHLVCEACAEALKKQQQKPAAIVQRKAAVSDKRPTAASTDRKPAEDIQPTKVLLPP